VTARAGNMVIECFSSFCCSLSEISAFLESCMWPVQSTHGVRVLYEWVLSTRLGHVYTLAPADIFLNMTFEFLIQTLKYRCFHNSGFHGSNNPVENTKSVEQSLRASTFIIHGALLFQTAIYLWLDQSGCEEQRS